MASIRCAHCKRTHHSVAEVKACSLKQKSVRSNFAQVQSDIQRVKELEPMLPQAQRAHYALWADAEKCWKFYRVDMPQEGRWTGYVFLSAQASDDYWPMKLASNRAAVYTRIIHDPVKAAEDYGQQLGKCSICNRTLTLRESIERGIGPVCAGKMGW